jgi:hypothetical protein
MCFLLSLCVLPVRFETAHIARLAYDQAVTSLSGSRKRMKTNYPEVTAACRLHNLLLALLCDDVCVL